MKRDTLCEAWVKFVNNARHVWHDMSWKTHQDGQESAIKRDRQEGKQKVGRLKDRSPFATGK